MRIAMVSDNVLPTPVDGWGGLERVIYDLTEALLGRGHDVTLLGAKGSHCSGKTVETTEPAQTWADEEKHVDLVEKYILSHGPFDVIHDNTHMHMLHRRRPDWPIINESQDDIDMPDHNMVVPSFALRHAHRLTAARVIYNAVDLDFWNLQEPAGDYLLYMSVVSKRKGADVAAKAAVLAKRRLLIAGRTDWDYEFYKNELAPLVDGHWVQFIGPVEGEAKRRLLAGARGLVLWSRHCEPGALTVLEAQALGVPCIVSPNGCLPEYVEHGAGGLVCPTLPDVVRAYTEIDRLPRATVRSRARAVFGRQRLAEQFEQLYRERSTGSSWVGVPGQAHGHTRLGPKDVGVLIVGRERGAVRHTLKSLIDSTYMGWYAICVGVEVEAGDEVFDDPRVKILSASEDLDLEMAYGRFRMALQAGEALARRELVTLVRAASAHRQSAGLACTIAPRRILWRQPGPMEGAQVTTVECED